LGSIRSKNGLKTFLVLRPQFFKISIPSKTKTKDHKIKPALAKTKPQKNGHMIGLKNGLKTFLVLRPQSFKTSTPSKTKDHKT